MLRITYLYILLLFSFSTTVVGASVTLATLPVRYIGMDSAISGGRIINSGGEQVVEAGICWSKNPQPTVNNFLKERSIASDSFTCVLNNLGPGEAYYVRAYAVTASGIWYSQQRTFATDILKYGDVMKGGMLFYVLQAGDPGYKSGEFHGLVLHVITSNSTITWRNSKDTLVGTTDTSMFAGYLNTTKIVNALGEGNYAAKACYDLVHQGFSDWYLPSQNELRLALKRLNYYISGYAWSSSEFDKANAIQCTSIRIRNSAKTQKGIVYAIRKF